VEAFDVLLPRFETVEASMFPVSYVWRYRLVGYGSFAFTGSYSCGITILESDQSPAVSVSLDAIPKDDVEIVLEAYMYNGDTSF
jgi:hypothetical protein